MASYSEDELKEAFKNAHNAGDTVAAGRIVAEIDRLRSQATPSQSGEYAVSTDIKPQATVDDNLMAAATEGFTKSFSGSLGTMATSHMFDLGRLFAKDPKTGETRFWLSTPEWLGMTDDQWEQMEPDDRRQAIVDKTKNYIDKEYDPDRSSKAFMIGNVAGMLTDPSTMIPLTGPAKWMAVKGAALGATDAAVYSLAEEGKIDPEMVGVGAAFGLIPAAVTVAPKVVKAAAKKTRQGIRRVTTPKAQRLAQDELELFNKGYEINKQMVDNPMSAYYKTLDDLGMKEDRLIQLAEDAGKKPVRKRQTGMLDQIIEPISDRIRKISPQLHRTMLDGERKILEMSHNWISQTDEFLTKTDKVIKKASAEDFHNLKKAMLNGDGATIKALVGKHLGEAGVKAHDLYKKTMDEMWEAVSEARSGSIGKKVENYTHRAVKDYKQIEDYLRRKYGKEEIDRIQKIVRKQVGNRKATQEELNGIYSRYLDGIYDTDKVKITPGATKGRRLKEIPDELVDAFHDPGPAAHSYIRAMSEDINRKAIFGKDVLSKVNDIDNISDSIAEFVSKEHQAGRLKADDVDELKTLLELRFSEGIKKPHETIQKFKDLSYSMLLGNPVSAVTQLGDVFLATWKNGFRNTMHGVSQALTGKGLSPKEFGLLDSMLEELVSTGTTQKILRGSLKWGGFQKVDQLGKATLMNGSLRKYKRMAAKNPKKLEKQWGEAFGDDFPKLVEDLKKGELTGDVKTLVFADLSDVQPVTLLEMPEMYLKHPNGRVMYMLRTFQLKYINLLRKTMIEGFKKGNRRKAILSGGALMSMFTAGGMTSDQIKNLLLNRDEKLEDLVVDNILANTGIMGSRYQAGKLLGSQPLTSLGGQLLPPVGVFDPYAHAVVKAAMGEEIENEDWAKMVGKIPLIGRILENYAMGGLERHQERQFKESLKLDLDVDL